MVWMTTTMIGVEFKEARDSFNYVFDVRQQASDPCTYTLDTAPVLSVKNGQTNSVSGRTTTVSGISLSLHC
jgi:hypothetical protein